MTLSKRVKRLECESGSAEPDVIFIMPLFPEDQLVAVEHDGFTRVFGCAKAFVKWPNGTYDNFNAEVGETYADFQERVHAAVEVTP